MSDYKRNPRSARRARKSLSRKALVVLSLMMVLVMAAVGGTLAWLTATTTPVTNTFTTSDINITLAETTGTSYKMVPGCTITKDPKVTVVANSEPCYLFVKLDKSSNFDSFMTYTIAEGWTELTGVTGVYYRVVESSTAGQEYKVLKDDQVQVKDSVTKSDMNGLTASTYPTLKVTAYATQYMKDNNVNFTATEAWAKVQPAPGA